MPGNYCSKCGHHLHGPYCAHCGAAAVVSESLLFDGARRPEVGSSTLRAAVDPAAHAIVLKAFRAWLIGFVVYKLIDFMLVSSSPQSGSESMIGFYATIAVQMALAWWLLWQAERGSPLARRAFSWVFGVWAAFIIFTTLLAMANTPSTAVTLDFVGAIAYCVGIFLAVQTLRDLKPALVRASLVRGEAPVTVTLRTEMPSFVATVLLLVLGIVQLAKDWGK